MAFSYFGSGLSGKPGSAAGFAMTDEANRSKAAPALGGNPSSAESIDAGGAAGSLNLVPSTTATADIGEAAILHTAGIERSYPRVAAFCCNAESKASKLSSAWSHLFRRTHGRKSP